MGLISKHKSKYIYLKKRDFWKNGFQDGLAIIKWMELLFFVFAWWCDAFHTTTQPTNHFKQKTIFLFCLFIYFFLGSFQCCTSTTGKHLNFTSILIAKCTFKKIYIWYAALNFVWNFFFLSLLFDRARLGSIQWRRRMYTHRFLFINVVFLFIF